MAQRIWAALALAAAALCGCGKPEPAAKAKIAGGFDVAPPAPRPGLWRISTTGKARQTTRLCVDAASAAAIGPGAGPADGRCAEHSWTRRADGALVFTSTCDLGAQGTRRATAVLTGDMARAYRMTVSETTAGAAAPPPTARAASRSPRRGRGPARQGGAAGTSGWTAGRGSIC